MGESIKASGVVRHGVNLPGGKLPSHFAEILQWRSSLRGADPAFVYLEEGEHPGPSLTFAEVDGLARSMAVGLLREMAPLERVLLFHPSGLDFVVALLGCFYAGVVAVPAHMPRGRRGVERLATVAQDCGARAALTTAEGLEKVRPWASGLPGLEGLRWMVSGEVTGDGSAWRPPALDHDSLAFIQYTSGSTSRPKGVRITHGCLLHNSLFCGGYVGAGEGDTSVSWLPHYHDMGLMQGVLLPVFSGYRSVIMAPERFLQRPVRWLRAISAYGAVESGGPNFAYELCVRKIPLEDRAGLDLHTWRVALNGAEPVRAATLRRFTEAFAPHGFDARAHVPCYGMAETMVAISFHPPGTPTAVFRADAAALEAGHVRAAESAVPCRELVGCGVAAEGHERRIVDPETRTPSPPDRVGEVWVRGPSVSPGYLDRPEDTAATFDGHVEPGGEGPYLRTGDLGFIHEGQLYITGRHKDLIILNGRNLYPQDIELTVEQCVEGSRPGSAAAFSIDEDGAERLVVAQEVRRPGKDAAAGEALAARVRAAVARDHDAEIHTVLLLKQGALPKTSSGKVRRAACREAWRTGALALVGEYVLPPDADPAPRAEAPVPSRDISDFLAEQVAARLGVSADAVDRHGTFASFGLSSITLVEMAARLEDFLGRPVSATLAYACPTIDAMARHLAEDRPAEGATSRADAVAEPVAVVGMACRFPGADSPESFWRLLEEGRSAVGEVPPDRWLWEDFYAPEPGTPNRMNTKWGGFLDDVAGFDAGFFGISPREALHMDPQQRVLLEVCWEAFEDAGMALDRTEREGVGAFIGVGAIDHLAVHLESGAEKVAYFATGNAQSVVANRLSYALGLGGPSIAMDTACSSALVAIHQARAALLNRDCHVAAVGAVGLILCPLTTVALSQARMMASDGRCKTFDAAADGYVRGEGCGVVVLKRLHDALEAGDRVLAIIRGSAVNHCGPSNGLTAPSAAAQARVIRAALSNGGVSPADIQYVEAHGTGTALGDPIEVEALRTVLDDGAGGEPCTLGAAKTNIGHLETTAGMAGFIKTVLALRHETIPANLNFETLNPHINLDGSRLRLAAAMTPWPRGARRRIAGVSAFGFGGANAHVVLEEPPATPPAVGAEAEAQPPSLLALSAATQTALRALASRHAAGLEGQPDAVAGSWCRETNRGRAALRWRAAVPVRGGDGAVSALREHLSLLAAGEGAVSEAAPQAPPVAFLFTGQGAQYPGMGRGLYDTDPLVRGILDECDALTRDELDRPLLDVIFGAPEAAACLSETAYTQPALFALEYALFRRWAEWGIRPDAVLGHSLGEYAAVCAAGGFSLADGLRLVTTRGRLIQSLPSGGAMAAVLAPEVEVRRALEDEPSLDIAAVNGPGQAVVSGPAEAVGRVSARFADAGVRVRPMDVSHAFHSCLLDPVLDAFEEVAAQVAHRPLDLPLVSNLTGTVLPAGHTLDAAYWRSHLRRAVRFADGMEALRARGCGACLEIGPSRTMLGMARGCLGDSAALWLPSLRKGHDDRTTMLDSLGKLFEAGATVDWDTVCGAAPRAHLPLPTYPFEHKSYWILGGPARVQSTIAAGAVEAPECEEAFTLAWRELPDTVPGPDAPGRWVLVAPSESAARTVADAFGAAGQETVRVTPGETYAFGGEEVRIDPSRPDDYQRLLADVCAGAGPPLRGVVVLPAPGNLDAHVGALFRAGCARVLHVVHAMVDRGGRGEGAPKLYLVTQKALHLSGDDPEPCPLQAAIWGLGRTVGVEHPEIHGALVDVCGPTRDWAEPLAARLVAGTPEAQLALRASAWHAARIVRLAQATEEPVPPCRPDATYLVTGGLGALGRKTAAWLVARGARRLLLLGRTPLPPRAEWAGLDPESGDGVLTAAVCELERLGASVHVAAVDIADAAALRECLDRFELEQRPPIAGVFHLAGVLDDRQMRFMDGAAFDRVARPKVDGAWNLHEAFEGKGLDLMVFYSSAASFLGSAGQANYAAANGFLDGLAALRRARGQHALSINWGPWAEVGMAARTRQGGHPGQQVVAPMAPDTAVATLEPLLASGQTQAAVLRADWARLAALYGPARLSGLLEELVGEVAPGEMSDAVRAILDAPPGDGRDAMVMAYLRAQIGHLLGVPAEEVDAGRDLIALGLDSIMVMDLARALERDLGVHLHTRVLFTQADLAALVGAVAQALGGGEEDLTADREQELERVRSVIANVYDSVPRGAPPAAKCPPCVFLLSSPRSGSTLLRVMLSAHPGLFSPPEMHLLHFHNMTDRAASTGPGSALGEGLQRAFMELRGIDGDEADALVARWSEAGETVEEVYRTLQRETAPRLLVDKSPSYSARPETLRRAEELFDQARYLYLHRHPYSVVESYVRTGTGRAFPLGDVDPFLVAETVWTDTNETVLAFLSTVPADRQLRVGYEDLVRQPEVVTASICAFLGLPPCEAMHLPYAQGRMLDGIRPMAPMVGDPNFKKHTRIEARLADTWREVSLPHPLGARARAMARSLGYDLPHEEESPAARAGVMEEERL